MNKKFYTKTELYNKFLSLGLKSKVFILNRALEYLEFNNCTKEEAIFYAMDYTQSIDSIWVKKY